MVEKSAEKEKVFVSREKAEALLAWTGWKDLSGWSDEKVVRRLLQIPDIVACDETPEDPELSSLLKKLTEVSTDPSGMELVLISGQEEQQEEKKEQGEQEQEIQQEQSPEPEPVEQQQEEPEPEPDVEEKQQEEGAADQEEVATDSKDVESGDETPVETESTGHSSRSVSKTAIYLGGLLFGEYGLDAELTEEQIASKADALGIKKTKHLRYWVYRAKEAISGYLEAQGEE